MEQVHRVRRGWPAENATCCVVRTVRMLDATVTGHRRRCKTRFVRMKRRGRASLRLNIVSTK